MSISARSTKSAMYSEIERLRELLDRQDQQLRAAHEERERLTSRMQARNREVAQRSERGTRNLMMKRLAVTCKASVKWVDGQGFRQLVDGNWMPIPTHTIEFVAKGIEQ